MQEATQSTESSEEPVACASIDSARFQSNHANHRCGKESELNMNGAVMFLAYFLLLLFLYAKYRTVAIFLIGIQIASMLGTFFVGGDYSIDSIPRAVAFVITLIILSSTIVPWAKDYSINNVISASELKVINVTKALLVVSALPFVVLSITVTLVLTQVTDINHFKYTPGVAEGFLYSMPINVRWFILSTYLQYLAPFLIPLHFYHLAKKRYLLATLCFVFSLNVILYGMTFFSRASIAHYLLMYASILILMWNILDRKTLNVIRKVAAVVVLSFITYFIVLTNRRFADQADYHDAVPLDAIVQNPIAYSYLSYLSQSARYGVEGIAAYDFKTFSGQTTFSPILELMGRYGLMPYSREEYSDLRKALWEDRWDKFVGLSCYLVYDFGYCLTGLLCIAYFRFVRWIRPVNGQCSFGSLLHYVMLLQIPSVSIFYSVLGALVIPYMLIAPILIYLGKKPSSRLGSKAGVGMNDSRGLATADM